MLSPRSISLALSYLVALGGFFSLHAVASSLVFFPLLALFMLSTVNEWKLKVYPPRWFLNIAGIGLSLVLLSELSLENPVVPFANVILLLITIKGWEKKRPRDIYQILLLSLFGVALSTTFRLDPTFLAFFAYELFLGTVAFLFTNLYSGIGDKPLSGTVILSYAKFALLFPPLVAFVSIPFFVLLPRPNVPIFDLFTKKKGRLVSGISNEVELGKVGTIQLDNTVVMRVYGSIPQDPYWRVSVFDTFVGTKWVTTIREKEQEATVVGRNGFTYTFIMEPSFDTFLPLLDFPVKVLKVEGLMGSYERLKGGFYRTARPLSRPIKVRAVSSASPPIDEPVDLYLQVPKDIPKSVVSLAKKLAENRSPMEKVRSVVDFFGKGFRYSLELKEFQGNPIEHFLFRSKEGNCEYFASSTAILFRLMGLPARVVGGYRGAIRNDFGNYYIVTNSMAHVWVEVFVDGRWLRVDTTPPYVSPSLERISRFDLFKDALISFWYENVVDFSTQKQIGFVRGLAEVARSLNFWSLKTVLSELAYLFIFLLLSFCLAFAYRSLRRSPENLYRKLIKKLETRLKKDLKNVLPEEVLKEIEGEPYYKDVRFIVELYQRYRFSRYKPTNEEIKMGYRVLRKI